MSEAVEKVEDVEEDRPLTRIAIKRLDGTYSIQAFKGKLLPIPLEFNLRSGKKIVYYRTSDKGYLYYKEVEDD